MTGAELETLLGDVEADWIERKQAISDKDRICEAVCAFANDLPDHKRPGVLFVGVDDAGRPTGLPVTDELLKTLSAIRSDGNVLPFPAIDVQKRRLLGVDVAVVLVHPSTAPPVKYRGRIWIRSGPRRGIGNRDDERRLEEKRRFRDHPFDLKPIESADLSAIDDVLFQRVYLPAAVAADVLATNDRTVEQRLLAVKFAHPGPPVVPTVVGLLAVGKSPTDWMPGAYVQFLRIDGPELSDPIRDAQEIRGPLHDLIAKLDLVMGAHIQTAVDITSGTVDTRTPTYPIGALQQIARNAILHRSYDSTNAPVRVNWYDDRVVILNPGGPYGQVNKANFGEPDLADYRNPNLAAAMKDYGYVQRFGVGIATARSQMRDNGNPPPEFRVEDSFVSVTLRIRSKSANPRQ